MTLLVEIDLTAGGAALLWPCTLPFNQSAIYAEFVNLDTAVVTTPPKINESNLKP